MKMINVVLTDLEGTSFCVLSVPEEIKESIILSDGVEDLTSSIGIDCYEFEEKEIRIYFSSLDEYLNHLEEMEGEEQFNESDFDSSDWNPELLVVFSTLF